MSKSKITKRLLRRVRRQNKQLKIHALIEAGMGLAVTFGVYGFMFAGTWMLGWLFFASTNSAALWFALAVTGTFFLVAAISAWRKVDPTAELAPLPKQDPTVEWMENTLSSATGVATFNPRFALAGAGLLLLSGPANLIEAFASWRHRFPEDDDTLNAAAELLVRCKKGGTAGDIRDPRAAILLRRLTLVHVVTAVDVARLELTDRGRGLLEK